MAIGDVVRHADYRHWGREYVIRAKRAQVRCGRTDAPRSVPMSDEVKNYITPGGCRRLQEELARLWTVARPPIVTTVAWVKPASASTPLAIMSTRIDVAKRLPPKTGAANNIESAKKKFHPRMSRAYATEGHLDDRNSGSHDCRANAA